LPPRKKRSRSSDCDCEQERPLFVDRVGRTRVGTKSERRGPLGRDPAVKLPPRADAALNHADRSSAKRNICPYFQLARPRSLRPNALPHRPKASRRADNMRCCGGLDDPLTQPERSHRRAEGSVASRAPRLRAQKSD
jgi:hypothetical protein